MDLRLSCAVLLAVGCCLISLDDCAAQRHPARSQKALATPPLPPNIRLVQALDEDLDDVLGTAQDLLDELDADSGDSTLGLDLDDTPRPVATGSDTPKLPRTLDEYQQQRAQLPGVGEEDGLGLEGLTDEGDGLTEESVNNRYQDVDPKPVQRRPRPNIPYSLGDVLRDEDEIDPCCEQEFCRRMWDCAGGRCQSSFQRWNRDLERDRLIRRSCNNPSCLKTPFSEPFVCPKRQQTQSGGEDIAYQHGSYQDDQYQNGQYGAGPYEVISDRACSPDEMPAYDDRYEPTLDEFPDGLQDGSDALDFAPISDDSTSRRPENTRLQ